MSLNFATVFSVLSRREPIKYPINTMINYISHICETL